MKHIKQVLVFLLIISVFNSCEKEEVVSYALDDISAPTNIAALFDISAEEVGLVTITPSADGATMFEIYFGDVENETPTEVAPGETITHVYGEGEFNLRIVAVGLTGLTSELVRVVTISLEAPEDLEVDVKISGTNPFEIEVTPSATNATVFDVYFGDVEDEEPTTIMAGETATHVYAEVGDYSVRVVARGAGAATLELTKDVSITGASNAMSLPLTFDDATVNYAFVVFNGASFEVVDNPDVSGANDTASKVGAITNSGAQWEGGSFELDPPVDFSGDNKTITMKFWSEVSLPVLLKFEGGVNNERQNEVAATHGGTGWEVLTFNFATDAVKSYIDGTQGVGEPFVPTGKYASLVLFIDGPGTSAGTFYIDDIAQSGANGGGNGGDPTAIVGTWKIAPEAGSLGVGPAIGDKSWWAINDAGVTERACFYDDEYVFNSDGSFSNVLGSETWLEAWQGTDNACGAPVAPHDGTDSATYTYNADAGTVTINGTGAYLGLPKANNAGELPNVDVPTSISYNITLSDNDNTMNLVIESGAGVFWQFKLVREDSGNGGGNGTSGPTAAAPTPTAAAGNVKSIFSDAYTDPAGVNYSPDWGQSTAFEKVSISGNDAIKYSNLNYQGIDIGENVDATAFESVRIDVWSGDYTSLPFFLISAGSGEKSITLNLTPNQWNSIDIPLSEFTSQGLSVNDIFQFKFDVQPDNGGTIYIDNLYFYTSGDNGGNNGGDNGGTTGVAPYSPIDFETGGYGANWTWTVFENGSDPALEIVANPTASGINTSSTVAKFTALQAGKPWAGVESKRNEDIGDFTFDASNSIVKVMVYKTVISDVGLKFSEASGEAQPEVKVANTKINEWEELTFDMSGSIGKGITGIITQIIIFPDFQNRSSDNVVYFDNITFGSN